MKQLADDVSQSEGSREKNVLILNAKNDLMSILTDKFEEYLDHRDPGASEIFKQICTGLTNIVHSSLGIARTGFSPVKEVKGKDAQAEQLKKLLAEKDEQLMQMTREAERLNHEMLKQLEETESLK